MEEERQDEYRDWKQLETDYYKLLHKLEAEGRLRSALLRKNGENIHCWPPDESAD
jgi:hypothetical protein